MLADKYRLDGLLGAGGMGVVLEAWHLRFEERVAIKLMLSQIGASANARGEKRTHREAPAALGEAGLDQSDVDAVVVVLSTVAEVVGELGGPTVGQCADAIDILERLLPDARLSPARYHATVRCYPEGVRDALSAVHLATRVMDRAPDQDAR